MICTSVLTNHHLPLTDIFFLNAPPILIVFPEEPTFDMVTEETNARMAVAEVRLNNRLQTHFLTHLVMDYADIVGVCVREKL